MEQWWARSGRTRLAVVALASGLGASVVHFGALVALAVPAILGALVLIALVRGLIRWPDEPGCHRILWWTIVSFGAHLALGLAVTNAGYDVRYYLATDSIGYHERAVALVNHWTDGTVMPVIPSGKEGFYYLLGGLYWVFGTHTAAGLAVNAVLGAALVPITSDTTHRLFGPAAARYAGPLVVLLPGMFLWTSQLMKEAAMLFLLAVALNCAVRVVHRIGFAPMAILTVALVLAFTFRAWVALVVAGGLLVAIAISSRHLLSGLGNGLSALLVVMAVMLGSGVGYSGYEAAVNSDLKQANVLRLDLAYSARTGYDAEADVSTTGAALSYLPRGTLSFLFGPMPWNIQSARQLPFVPDMLVWWALLPSLWRGLRASPRLIGKRSYLMILPALGTVLMMSLALGNFGIVVRERLQVQILVVPLIALGLAERARRRADRETAPDTAPAPASPAPALELIPQG